MKLERIINYLEYPPETGERFIINGKDFGAKVDFSNDVLKEKINELSEKDKEKLLEKVTTVCEQWKILKGHYVKTSYDIAFV